MRVTLGGAEVDLIDADEVLERVRERLEDATGAPLYIASANLDHLHHFGLDSGREGSFDVGRGSVDWLILLDGMPLVWVARRLTGTHWEQLAGSDLLPDLLRVAGRTRARVGFLGGDEVQQRVLAAVLADRFPNVDLAGFWVPERAEIDDPETSAELARSICAAGVDLLVVGLGKPRQEEWLLHHGTTTGARVAVAFGAATEFLAGTARRAPPRVRRIGLEWLHRFMHEPRRLARRYLVQGPASLYRLLTQSQTSQSSEVNRQACAVPVLSSPGLWQRRLGKLLVFVDALAIALASLLAYVVRDLLGRVGPLVGFAEEFSVAIAVLPFWLLILWGFGCYRPQYLASGGETVRRFMAGCLGGLLVLGFISFALGMELSRGYVGMLFLFAVLLGGGGRAVVRAYLGTQRARGRFVQNVLVAGTDDEARQVVRGITATPKSGYRVVGFLDDVLEPGTFVFNEIPVVGRPADVLDHAYDTRAGLVIVSPSGVQPGALQGLLVALEGSPVDLAVAPSLFEIVSRRVAVESVGSVALLHVDEVRLEGGRAILKRALDFVGALALLGILWPIMAVAALAVRLDSRGPVLFHQTRVGQDGHRFRLHKFRTMVVDAEERLPDVADLNEAGHHFFKVRHDPRITRAGRVLRRWSIDEAPQLWNVLRGEMSLVGPRPPIPTEVDKYEQWHLRRLRIKPGITGVWQVSGRSSIPFDEAVRMDIFYIENWSLGYDLFLLAKTVLAVLGRQGAY